MDNTIINKANIFNTALPGIGADLLAADIVPMFDPGLLRIYISLSVNGEISIVRTVGAASVTEKLNSGNALGADNSYMFTVAWKAGESINLTCSSTGGNINKLQIDESWT